VRRKSALVLEGFPRSGNSFALRAIQLSQPERLRIAHHLHVPAQILRAAEWRVPALVLIRRPADATISSLQRVPWLSAEEALAHWLWFYESIAPAKDWYVLAPFDVVTTRFGEVIAKVNARYGTQFTPFEHTPENVEKVFQRIDQRAKAKGRSAHEVSRPTAEREARRAEVARRLESAKCRELLASCDALYDRLTGTV